MQLLLSSTKRAIAQSVTRLIADPGVARYQLLAQVCAQSTGLPPEELSLSRKRLHRLRRLSDRLDMTMIALTGFKCQIKQIKGVVKFAIMPQQWPSYKVMKFPGTMDMNTDRNFPRLYIAVEAHAILTRLVFLFQINYSHMSQRMIKSTKWHVCAAMTQISLGIHPVLSVFAVRSMDS